MNVLELLWLIPAFPIAGFLVLALAGPRLQVRVAAAIGVGSIGLSAIVTLAIAAGFLVAPPSNSAFSQTLWTWIGLPAFRSEITLYLDPLSLVMVSVVTVVGFLIHLYSVEYMAGDEGFSRFFAYMNLFVASMVILLLAGDLLLLYLGWEGVGLCSYLLIGFWYQDPANGRAARKAFIVTRVGDVAFALGLFLIFSRLGTFEIQEAMRRAATDWGPGSTLAAAAAVLLLGGAVGKSAQIPLQTWLPDAMAGPTPTSALIHAATMVTAGVYLIARTNEVFILAPEIQFAVALVGAVTLLIAGFSALTQSDIKRILAYSTISQIGYMFLALGAGAWAAGIFHFMTHAFFKALLFLAAGSVITSLHHEQNIFKMGGLRRELPVAFWSFLIGGSALAGLPLITAGFYSKDLILWETLASEHGNTWLWLAGLAGVLLTSLYTYRLIFVVFFGELRTHVSSRPGPAMRIPLVVLSALSVVGGFVNVPKTFGEIQWFSGLMHKVLPEAVENHEAPLTENLSAVVSSLVFLAGLSLAYLLYMKRRELAETMGASAAGRLLHSFWLGGWGFDWIYERLFIWPVLWFARVNTNDAVDMVYTGVAKWTTAAHRSLSLTETGQVRWYAAGIVAGTVLLLTLVLMS